MEPMLARPCPETSAPELLGSPDWVLQPKIDGERLLVAVVNGEVRGWNRAGTQVTVSDRIIENMCSPGLNFMLDGELVGDTFLVFDAPGVEGFCDESTRLSERLNVLSKLFGLWNPDPKIRQVMSVNDPSEKRALLQRIYDGNGEGVMLKNMRSLYRYGDRSRDWLKLKRHHSIDCVVTSESEDRNSVTVSVYKDGALIDPHGDGIGTVGTLTGDGPYVKVGDVIEVRVLYTSRSGRIVQPTLPRIRGDKNPVECTFDQIESAKLNKDLTLEMVV